MDPALATELLRSMLLIRRVEEKIVELYPEQEMRCPVHLCIGQEAVAAGVCAALEREDYVLSAHRSHGHYLAKGGDLSTMFAEIYGKADGCCQGKGGSMHLVDLAAGFLGATPIVGSTIPIAVGTALGSQMRNEQRVTVVFFGDGAAEEGVLCESLNFAALKRLPVVFVCEDNRYSVYSPLCVRQPEGRPLHGIATAHGVPGVHLDGNDPAAVHDAAREAATKARGGEGPTFLLCDTYRHREHCGPNCDDALGYRPVGELQHWLERCPLQSFRQRLLDAGTLTAAAWDRLLGDIDAAVDTAVTFAHNSPFPAAETAAEHVFAPSRREVGQ